MDGYHDTRGEYGPKTCFNMRTGEHVCYSGVTARRAVVCAWAQAHGDNNTWDYARYEADVRETEYAVYLGDWGCRR